MVPAKIALRGATSGAGRMKKFLCSALLAASAGPGMHPLFSPEDALARMEQKSAQRQEALLSYQARRRYLVAHGLLGKPAFLLVQEHYMAPEEKQFRVLERSGPEAVEKRVFQRLLKAERDAARSPARQTVELCRRNYRFAFQRYDPAAQAYVFQVEPRNSSPYALRGKIWVDAQEYAVQRIEGEPARDHSIFIHQSRFVREFAKFGDFWFPIRHRSEAELFLFGRATLEIDFFDYQWETRRERAQ